MATGKALPGEGARTAAGPGWARPRLLVNPLRAVWWLFTNVRFAIFLLALLSAVSVLGVVLPQVPSNVRGDAFAEADWLQFQEGKFGPFTDPIDRVGLFDIFHARWFAMILAVTVAATGAYVVSRFPGIWRTVTAPRKRVPDRYFQMAPHRLDLATALAAPALERALRRHRYRVDRFQEENATYLFADRYPWAQMGTLLTHAAVIIFIVAAVVSRMDSFEAPLFLSEGATLPVFPVRDANQMQVQLVDAHAAFSADGRPLDYRSQLVIYERGEQAKECASTVNTPCSYRGYHFYQAAYFGFGAAVQVRDLASGNVVYRETLALSDTLPSPHVVIRDAAGAVLLDERLLLTDTLSTDQCTYDGTLVRLPGERLLTVGVQRPAGGGRWRLALLEPGQGEQTARLSLDEGGMGETAGLEVSYLATGKAPAALVPDFPLPPTVEGGGPGQALLQMSNVVYGTATASEGTTVEGPAPSGPPRLTLVGLQPQAVSLEPGQSVTIGGYEYTFLGQSEFAGIQVKRDRSDTLVWAGAGLILVGLLATFWVPRRRLWAKIALGRTLLAGQAASHANYTRELRRLAREAGAAVPEEAEDDD
ncbi:MAG: cytochrome c biogenesis protein ResB [Chloroflexi bacterium]|nr:cytochrome c biogenesis protein ResB [Chloroflexota bacterium]